MMVGSVGDGFATEPDDLAQVVNQIPQEASVSPMYAWDQNTNTFSSINSAERCVCLCFIVQTLLEIIMSKTEHYIQVPLHSMP